MSRFWRLTNAAWCTRRPHTLYTERASISRAAVACEELLQLSASESSANFQFQGCFLFLILGLAIFRQFRPLQHAPKSGGRSPLGNG